MQPGKAGSCKFHSNSQGNFDSGKACDYCHEVGCWTAECAMLQAKNRGIKSNKPAAAAVLVATDCVLDSA